MVRATTLAPMPSENNKNNGLDLRASNSSHPLGGSIRLGQALKTISGRGCTEQAEPGNSRLFVNVALGEESVVYEYDTNETRLSSSTYICTEGRGFFKTAEMG